MIAYNCFILDALPKSGHPQLRIVNAYEDSLDIEWDFLSNITSYTVVVSTNNFLVIPTRMEVFSNEATIRNLRPGMEYNIMIIPRDTLSNCFGVDKNRHVLAMKFFSWNFKQKLPGIV